MFHPNGCVVGPGHPLYGNTPGGAATPAAHTTVAGINQKFTTIDDVLAYLMSYRVQDFYARIISALPIRPDSRVPMAAVTFERGHHVFLYNEKWVDKMLDSGKHGFEELRATIAHEAMHVVMTHISRQLKIYRGFSDETEKKRFLRVSNIGTDMAANTLLLSERDQVRSDQPAYASLHKNAKEWALPAHMQMPEELTYEWYVTLLLNKKACPQCAKKAVQTGKDPGKCPHGHKGEGDGPPLPGGSHAGGHDQFWVEMVEDLSDEEVEVLTTEIEGDAISVTKAAIEEHKKSRGTVPAHIEKALAELLKPTPVPWRKLLHQYVMRCRLSKPMRSLERPRKRFLNLGTTIYPGRKRDKTFNLAFLVDVSGSMSDADVVVALEELKGILSVNPEMRVMVGQFDTEIVEEPKEFTPKDDPATFVRKRCGGTDFNSAFRLAQQLEKKGRIDALIIFTDGYAPAPVTEAKPNHIPVLWCLTEGGVHPCPGYGYEIRRPSRD